MISGRSPFFLEQESIHMKTLLLPFLFAAGLSAQSVPGDRLKDAFQDRILSEGTTRLKTDERINLYQTLIKTKPENLHYRNLLAGAYIQKVRESMDFSYLDRASQVLSEVLSLDTKNYEALRLRTEVALERHQFKLAAEYSKSLTEFSSNDSAAV